ncbi:MAG: hypothetical protein V4666_08210 [Bacteroidota bacterium]
MSTFKRNIFKISIDAIFFIYNFAERSNSQSIACARSVYPNTLYAAVDPPVYGTQFYIDENLTIPFSFPEETSYWYKRDTNGRLYKIYKNGTLIDNTLFNCSTIPGTVFGFVRDGSQVDGNPTFHVPRVNYIDVSGNPQVWYPSMTSDICGFITALSITDTIYCFSCS